MSQLTITFLQFVTAAKRVPSLAAALPDTCHNISGPGIVYPADTFIEGPLTVYDNPVEKTGAHEGAYLVCIGNQEYVAYILPELVKLETELYDFAVREELVVNPEART